MSITTVLPTLPSNPASPIAASGSTQPPPQYFTYPDGLTQPPFDKWIYFEAKAGRHVVRDTIAVEGNGKDSTLSSVGLYLDDTALTSALSMVYESSNNGPFWGAVMEAAAQGGADAMKALATPGTVWSSLSQLFSDLKITGQKVINSINEGNIKTALADTAIAAFEATGAGNQIAAVLGARPNPRTTVLFDTQEYRSYTMSFLMVPRSLDEAQSIDNIIHFFQFYMLPKYINPGSQGTVGSFMIGFPYEFEISCRDGNNNRLEHINKFARSILKSVVVNHAVNEKTSFIKDNTGAFWPVATNLQLTFQEVILLDRASVEITRAGTQQLPDPNL